MDRDREVAVAADAILCGAGWGAGVACAVIGASQALAPGGDSQWWAVVAAGIVLCVAAHFKPWASHPGAEDS